MAIFYDRVYIYMCEGLLWALSGQNTVMVWGFMILDFAFLFIFNHSLF